MKRVWIIEFDVQYEPGRIIGVFETEQDAKDFYKLNDLYIGNTEGFVINQYELNKSFL